MRRHRSAKAQQRRIETRFASATENLARAIAVWLCSKDGEEFATVLRAFHVAAETEPEIARAAQDVFLRHHPVFGPILRTFAALQSNGVPATPSKDDIARDAQALEEFRSVFSALPSSKAALEIVVQG